MKTNCKSKFHAWFEESKAFAGSIKKGGLYHFSRNLIFFLSLS